MEVPHRPWPEADAAYLRDLFCAAIKPDPRRTVDQWADAERIVTEGAYEGPWRTSRTPYLREPMRRATLSDPCRRVTVRGSAQSAKTQLGLNLLGQILSETPAKALVVLPSINSARMYNRDKLEPMLSASPVLAASVAELVSRDGTGSTTTVKRGARGAQVEIVTASSSKDLQSRTVRVLVLEEISEYPLDVDNRGDPVDLAMARTIAWRAHGEKVLDISTPGIKGQCRVSALYEQGSGAQFLVPCPHCGHRQTLKIERLHTPRKRLESGAEVLDHGAARYLCEDCGVLIEEADKPTMLDGGAWQHDRPELADRHASYHLNILYSPFTPWSEVSRELEAATNNPIRAKAFHQQWLGEPWDEAHDLPKADILLTRRDRWQPGRIPPSVLFLMGATDVQGDRLVWAVWGFDRHFGQWLIDTGTLEGDPSRPEVWTRHDALLRTRWRDSWGKEWGAEVWGIDSGFLSGMVYAYARKYAGRDDPEVRALDGRDGWGLPPLGNTKRIDFDWQGQHIGTVALWPVGTWGLKSELASALRLTELGPGPDGWPPGAIRYNEIIDRAWLDELLSEHCQVNPRTGVRAWKKVHARNEAWDLAVYARALARHATRTFDEDRWNALAADRQGEAPPEQPDLATLWAPDLAAKAAAAVREAATAAAAAKPRTAPPAFVPRPPPGWITGHRMRF